jgi:hypothetical protein
MKEQGKAAFIEQVKAKDAELTRLRAENDGLRKDKERLEAFFGGGVYFDIGRYMEGVTKGWTVDQWREYIDAALAGEREDAGKGKG